MRNRAFATCAVPLFTAWAVVIALAEPSAQRRNRGGNGSQGLPVATNTIAQNPDAYYGKVVTLSAGIEQVLSKTAFVVDQRKAVPGKGVEPIGTPMLVIAPYLKAPIGEKQLLSLRGEVVKLDAAALAKLAAEYTLDLAAELGTKYDGQPVLVATSVIDAKYAELGRTPPPPAVPVEMPIGVAMKTIGPTFLALRAGTQESNVDGVTRAASTLQSTFTSTEITWKNVGQPPAAAWAKEAAGHALAIERAAAVGDWEVVKTTIDTLNQVCQSCHGAYR